MTETRLVSNEPRIVLFASAAQIGMVTDRLAGVAAIVITEDAGALDEDLRNAIRHAGTPVLMASATAERADGFDGLPAFTPDGKWMIWTSQRGPNTMNDPRPTSQMWVARVLDIAP